MPKSAGQSEPSQPVPREERSSGEGTAQAGPSGGPPADQRGAGAAGENARPRDLSAEEMAMTILGSNAKQTQTRFDYREEADGMIHEIYLW